MKGWIAGSLALVLAGCAPLTEGRCAHGDCNDGKGTFRWPQNRVYKGKFKEGQPDGQGELINGDGSSYKGGFAKGQFDGEGYEVRADGSTYEGTFKAGLRHGWGAEKRADYDTGWGHVLGKYVDRV